MAKGQYPSLERQWRKLMYAFYQYYPMQFKKVSHVCFLSVLPDAVQEGFAARLAGTQAHLGLQRRTGIQGSGGNHRKRHD